MTVDLSNLTINSPKADLTYFFDPDREYCLLRLVKPFDTLVVDNLTVGEMCSDFSLMGFGVMPRNLVIQNCHVTPNFSLFSDYAFDFMGYDHKIMVETLTISGEVTCGDINLPDMIDLGTENQITINHIDVADFKFNQIKQVNISNEAATEAFADCVAKLTLPDKPDLRMFTSMLKTRYASDIDVSYR